MAQAGTSVAGGADPQLDLLSESLADERKSVMDATIRFEAALAKSDKLKDDDFSPVAKLVRDRTNVEEARLNGSRARLATARDRLAACTIATRGVVATRATVVPAVLSPDEDEVAEKQEKKDKKILKRKLPAPKDG